MTGNCNKTATREEAEYKGLMKTPENAVSDTLSRRVRAAGLPAAPVRKTEGWGLFRVQSSLSRRPVAGIPSPPVGSKTPVNMGLCSPGRYSKAFFVSRVLPGLWAAGGSLRPAKDRNMTFPTKGGEDEIFETR
jgi:hypothetical protein